jgi:hypothetical protein
MIAPSVFRCLAAVLGAGALVVVLAVPAFAQAFPVRVVQAGDGTLYLVQGGNAWPLVPDAMSDEDLAALSVGDEVDGTIPSELLTLPDAPAPLAPAAPEMAPPEAVPAAPGTAEPPAAPTPPSTPARVPAPSKESAVASPAAPTPTAVTGTGQTVPGRRGIPSSPPVSATAAPAPPPPPSGATK